MSPVPIVNCPCCERCGPKVVKHCSSVIQLTVDSQKDEFPKVAQPRLWNPPDYERSEKEEELRAALVAMRKELWQEKVGTGTMMSPQAIWPTPLMMCMVDLAHYGRLTSTEDLQKQTPWFYNDTIGPRILAKINKIIPAESTRQRAGPTLSPFTATPWAFRPHNSSLQQMLSEPSRVGQLTWIILSSTGQDPSVNAGNNENDAQALTSPVVRKKRAPNKCMACGAIGHNRMSILSMTLDTFEAN